MNTSQKPHSQQNPPWKILRQTLLSWYDIHQRELPWRHANIADANPYQTWLSEIMLQQTTVDTVIPYFKAFLNRWPTVEDLANATIDQVLHQWQGLGYYRRAHNLHACARVVAKDFNGEFPNTIIALKALPGLGDYTAKAVSSIALNQAAVPIDGNVERVIARLRSIQEPFPAAKKLSSPVSYTLRMISVLEILLKPSWILAQLSAHPKNPDVWPAHGNLIAPLICKDAQRHYLKNCLRNPNQNAFAQPIFCGMLKNDSLLRRGLTTACLQV